jgi:hypothetical protein
MLHFIIGLVLVAVFLPYIIRLGLFLLPWIFIIGFVILLAATNH